MKQNVGELQFNCEFYGKNVQNLPINTLRAFLGEYMYI